MAKHVAYPCLVASFFFNFGGIDAKSSESSPQKLEESMATFRQSTINYDKYQDVSSGSESSYGLHDDEWLSSGTLSDTGSLSGSSSETRSDNDSDPDDPKKYIDQNPRSVLYAQHLQLWTDNIAQDKPQTAEEQTAVFEKSFPLGHTIKDVYRVVEAESGGNTHLFAPGITPVKLKIKGKIQSTPRRQDNRNRLSKGKSPIWVDPRDDKQGRCHMHHLGQLNSDTLIVMLPVEIHHSKGMHTKHGPSSIDRPAFAKEKKATRRVVAEQIRTPFPSSFPVIPPSWSLARTDMEDSDQEDIQVSARTKAKVSFSERFITENSANKNKRGRTRKA